MSLKVCPLLLIIVIASCKNSDTPFERISKKLKLDSVRGFRKDIPENYNDSIIYWYFIRKERNKIGLPSIENGSEVFQIRVWEEHDSEKMVLLLMYEDSTWNAKAYIYQGVSSDGHNVDSLAVNIVPLGEPKSGWNEFLNKLIDKGILELKDESKIPGYFEATDQPIIAVEIASKNYYRYYQLPGAYDQPGTIKDAKSMVEILGLIKNDFPQMVNR